VLVVYAATAFPSVPGGDSGELLAEACELGTAHPPGYPLFTLLNHLIYRSAPSWRYFAPQLPDESSCPGGATSGAVAWGANLLSCCFGAAAATLLSMAVEAWTVGTMAYSQGAAAAAGLIFALSPLTWEYSVGAEVFSLNK
jgi:Protein of unknown function (DUF2723)